MMKFAFVFDGANFVRVCIDIIFDILYNSIFHPRTFPQRRLMLTNVVKRSGDGKQVWNILIQYSQILICLSVAKIMVSRIIQTNSFESSFLLISHNIPSKTPSCKMIKSKESFGKEKWWLEWSWSSDGEREFFVTATMAIDWMENKWSAKLNNNLPDL